jgi:hypothetical protein
MRDLTRVAERCLFSAEAEFIEITFADALRKQRRRLPSINQKEN